MPSATIGNSSANPADPSVFVWRIFHRSIDGKRCGYFHVRARSTLEAEQLGGRMLAADEVVDRAVLWTPE